MDCHKERVREAVARAICSACGEDPDHQGDARGNALRCQDYGHLAGENGNDGTAIQRR